jgi:hypothetical protein
MLEISYTNGPLTGVKSGVILGFRLQAKLPTMSATNRALLSHDLQNDLLLGSLSPRQSAAVTECPMKYARDVANASPLELAALRRGDLRIEDLHVILRERQPVSARAIDDFIRRTGLSAVWARIEYATKPKANGHAPANDNASAEPVQLSL